MPDLPPNPASVRMYCPGVGDCFLITLIGDTGEPYRLLIDCGAAPVSPEKNDDLVRIVRDVEQTSGGRLDVVVATHPLLDHVSGFLLARHIFERLSIGEVWLPWTDAPGDALAARMRSRCQAAALGLRASAERMVAAGDDDGAERLRAVLRLFRVESPAAAHCARAAIDFLAAHPSRPHVRYFEAGGPVLRPAGDNGPRVYVLGPSRSPAALRGGPGAGDHAFSSAAAFFAAAGGASVDFDSVEQRHAFDPRYRLPLEQSEGPGAFGQRYFAAGQSWRQASDDWLGAAQQFILELEAHVNNSSLALAIELAAGGDVLLFPGDAQASSWTHWDQHRWRAQPPRAEPITAAELLARTVLYKVSHHGSSSGTPDSPGLDWMTSPRLTAMVPADWGAASRVGWNLPSANLVERLRRRTRGRTILARPELPERPEGVAEAEWSAYMKQLRVGPDGLYVEYSV